MLLQFLATYFTAGTFHYFFNVEVIRDFARIRQYFSLVFNLADTKSAAFSLVTQPAEIKPQQLA